MSSLKNISAVDVRLMIRNVPIFSGVDFHEQNRIAEACVLVEKGAGEVVIKQGDIGDLLYIIVRGRVEITKENEYKKVSKVNILTTGDVFGEIAILRNIPRTAFVTTLTPCTFLTINAADFLNLYQYFSAHSRDNIQLIIQKRLIQLNSIT